MALERPAERNYEADRPEIDFGFGRSFAERFPYDIWRRLLSRYLSTDDAMLSRYGSEVGDLLATIDEDPSLGKPLAAAPQFLRAEVYRAAAVEGALHLEDIFIARVRLNSEARDRGGAAVDEVAEIAAAALGWDAAKVEEEKANYRARIAAELAAEDQSTDAAASAARMEAHDIVG